MKLTADSSRGNHQGRNSRESASSQSASKGGLATTARSSHRSSCGCGGRCPRCRAEAAEPSDAGLATQGRPLEPQTLGTMESALGHRLRDVRVHTDPSAASAARRQGAEAYAVGRNVVFAAGRYRPGTPAGRELLAHELAHVVQQRHATQVSAGAGPSTGVAEVQARRAAERVAQGRRALLPTLGSVPGVQLQDEHRFGAGRQQVVVRGETVTVNGTRIPATARPDGSIVYRNREIVLDGNGIFRRRSNGTIARPCNPEYYDRRGRRLPGVELPSRQERSSQYYDPRTREYRPWNPPEVQRVRRRGARPAEPAAPRADRELATRMREVNRVRTDFETRVRALVDSGVDETLARRQVRLQIESGGRPLPGAGEFERGQTYAGSRGPSGEVTITAARQSVAAQEFTRVAARRLDAYLARLNQRLGTRFVVNPQSLNHAEVRQLVLHPDRTAFYPDRAMCDSCQRIFTLEARARGVDLHVIDPDGTARVFTPDGRIVEFREGTVYERQTSVRTTGQGEQRQTRVEVRNDARVVHRARPRAPGEASTGRSSGTAQGSGDRRTRPPAAGNTTNRPPAAGNTATNRPPAAGNTATNRPPAAGNTATNRPPAAGNTATNRPPAAGNTATNRPPAAGNTATNRPSAAGNTATNRPPAAGNTATNRPPTGASASATPSSPAGARPTAPPTGATPPAATPRPTPATPGSTPRAPGSGTARVPTPAVPRTPAAGPRGGPAGGGRPRGGGLRGVGGNLAMNAAMVAAMVLQVILDVTIVARLNRLIADLEEWQAEQLRRRIEEGVRRYLPGIELAIERLGPRIEARWAQGQSAYVQISYDVLYTDERPVMDRRTSLFDDTVPPIESLFDIRFHGLESVRVELADTLPENRSTEIAPARERTLFGGEGDQRTTFLFNDPLLHQSIVLGHEVVPPEPEPESAGRVQRVILSCNEDWIAFQTDGGTFPYDLDHCGLSQPGTYLAQVTQGTENVMVGGRSVQRPTVAFALGEGELPEDQSFEFTWVIRDGQENPATLFAGQSSVPVQVVHSIAPFRSPEDIPLP